MSSSLIVSKKNMIKLKNIRMDHNVFQIKRSCSTQLPTSLCALRLTSVIISEFSRKLKDILRISLLLCWSHLWNYSAGKWIARKLYLCRSELECTQRKVIFIVPFRIPIGTQVNREKRNPMTF